MDLKLFFVTFAAVFLAELGDKTQLATMSLAAGNRHALLLVFAASAIALVSTSAIGVLAGSALASWIDPKYIRVGAGILFILIGLATLLLPDRKREASFGRLRLEFERYLTVEECRTCEEFQATIRDMAERGHPELRSLLEKLHVEPGARHEPHHCERCSTDSIRALFEEERPKTG